MFPTPAVNRRFRPRDSLAALLFLLVAACGDAPSPDTTSTTSTAKTSGTDSQPTTSVLDGDACDLLQLIDVSALAGIEMDVTAQEFNEFSVSSCKYASIAPSDPSAGRVLKLMLVDIYSGSQFYDLEGTFYPFNEREYVNIGDEGFVHIGDAVRGVTVQVSLDEMVLSINYTEQAILTKDIADAAAKADALVALVNDAVSG